MKYSYEGPLKLHIYDLLIDNPDIRPPRFENCPSWPVNVTVDRGSHEASLEQLADRLKATDQNGRPAKVKTILYSPFSYPLYH